MPILYFTTPNYKAPYSGKHGESMYMVMAGTCASFPGEGESRPERLLSSS